MLPGIPTSMSTSTTGASMRQLGGAPPHQRLTLRAGQR